MRMRYWDTYSAVYVLEGSGRFHDQDGLTIPVGPGDLMLMFPRHGYRYEQERDKPWSEFFIQFRGSIFGLWVKERLLSPQKPVHHIEPLKYWHDRLEAIIKPLHLPEPVQSLKRLSLLQDFFIDAVIMPAAPTTAAEQKWVMAARALIERDMSSAPDWETIARELNLSYHHFRRRFAQLTGVAPAKYRASKTIEHAGTLLKDRDLSLKAVAERCGFCDEFHFRKRFKFLTGLTPVQFRHRLE